MNLRHPSPWSVEPLMAMFKYYQAHGGGLPHSVVWPHCLVLKLRRWLPTFFMRRLFSPRSSSCVEVPASIMAFRLCAQSLVSCPCYRFSTRTAGSRKVRRTVFSSAPIFSTSGTFLLCAQWSTAIQGLVFSGTQHAGFEHVKDMQGLRIHDAHSR
jgi:hypothetical protein